MIRATLAGVDPLLSRRLRAQRLVGRPFATAEEAVRWLGAVQAQDYAGATWGLGQRVRNATERDVGAAFDRGSIVRTHVLRPTWHFVAPEDVRWMLALTAPRVRAAMAYYDRQLGLDEAAFRRSRAALERALSREKQLTRARVRDALEAAGIPTAGQRLGNLLMRAELDAVICSGPRQGKQHTYTLLAERAAPAPRMARDEALAELAYRYFRGHGPAGLRDFAWWSGLSVEDAKRGIAAAEGRLVEQADGETSLWRAQAPSPGTRAYLRAHLLPNYDEYVVGYKDRGHFFDAGLFAGARARASAALRDMALANNLVVLDGRVVGGWRRTVAGRSVAVAATVMVSLDTSARRALDVAARAYAEFLGLSCQLTIVTLSFARP